VEDSHATGFFVFDGGKGAFKQNTLLRCKLAAIEVIHFPRIWVEDLIMASACLRHSVGRYGRQYGRVVWNAGCYGMRYGRVVRNEGGMGTFKQNTLLRCKLAAIEVTTQRTSKGLFE
jgi:ribosomal protein L37AE/L43A